MTHYPQDFLRELYALAYITALENGSCEPHRDARVLAQDALARAPRLDDTGRAPNVPLRPNGGDRG